MRKIMWGSILSCFLGFVGGTNIFAATTTTSWGQMALLKSDIYSYFGLTSKGVDIQFLESKFSDNQRDTLNECIENKETHALKVVHTTIKTSVPVPGLPGRSTSVRELNIESVECLESNGLLYYWRELFKVGKTKQ